MKKFLFYLSALCLCLAFVACDDDDDKTGGNGGNGGGSTERVIKGTGVIDGKDCKITSVRQLYTPPSRYNEFSEIELQFILSNGRFFGLEAYVKDSETLKEGTYTSLTSSPIKDMSIDYADIYVDNEWNEDVYNVKMSVSIDNDIYTITVEGEYYDDYEAYENEEVKTFNFEYKGTTTYISYDVKPNGNGKVVYNGETYELNVGVQEYYGAEDGGAQNIELYLGNYDNHDIEVYFDMFVKSGNKLVAGTYEESEDYEGMSFNYGRIYLGKTSLPGQNAQVKISVSGDTYTITGKGEDYDEEPYTFEYTGELKWFDHRELSERANVPARSKSSVKKRR